MTLGNQNVRAVCLRDKLEFKFFFSLFFFLMPCYFRTKYKLCFIFMTKARKWNGRKMMLCILLELTWWVVFADYTACLKNKSTLCKFWQQYLLGDLSSSGMVAIKAILWAICVNGNVHNVTTLLSGSAFQINSKELLLTGQ